MEPISRRTLLTGLAAMVATAKLPTPAMAGLPTPAVSASVIHVATYGWTFQENAPAIEGIRDWFQVCLQHSVWHFDDATYYAPLIRHTMTRQTYVIGREPDGTLATQHIAYPCAPHDFSDPEHVVSYAALYAAKYALSFIDARRERHAGAIYFELADRDQWPPRDWVSRDAPPILLRSRDGNFEPA